LAPCIFIFYDYFPPAYKAGGPIRSIDNLVKLLGDEIRFYIYTTCKDLDGTKLDVKTDQWVNYNNLAKVFYASSVKQNLNSVRQLIKEIEPTKLYINGMFSLLSAVYPLIAARRLNIPVVFAPRGMLQAGALKLKSTKKKVYLVALRFMVKGLNITWHATDSVEAEDIKRNVGKNINVFEVGNVPQLTNHAGVGKKNDCVKFVTLSLIARKKNIGQFLSTLSDLKELNGKYEYHIFGPVKDEEYMNELKQIIDALKMKNIYFHGPLSPEMVNDKLTEFDFFVLPTLGENFGHAIFEALSAGLPVIISDQTPWRNLESKKAGWDVSLKNGSELRTAIKKAIDMTPQDYLQWSQSARELAESYVKQAKLKEKYLELFG